MNKERLLKLADHLEKGELGHKVFDFSKLNDGNINTKGCGTNGCAIGECPVIFEEWHFKLRGLSYFPELINSNSGIPSLTANTTWKDAREFFDLHELETDVLFLSSDYWDEEERDNASKSNNTEDVSINKKTFRRLFANATKEEVAQHIREFVKLKELLNVTI